MAAMIRPVSALIFQPLKHIHAVPVFISFFCSQSVQTPTNLFSAAFYSTLKTPISLPPYFETTPIGRFLLNDCGFSLHDANKLCTKRPDLLNYKSCDNLRQTLFFLRDKGIDESGVRKIFSWNPMLLRLSFQNNVKPKVDFLEKIGLTGHKLCKAFEKCPRIFSLSISRTLEPRVSFLQSVLDPGLTAVMSNSESDRITGKLVSNDSLIAYLVADARILTSPTEKLVGFVKDVEEMGIEKGSKAFARVLLSLSTLNRDNVKRKLENLRELRFTEEEIGIIFKKSPSTLGLSKENLNGKLENLRELGFTEEEVRILVKKSPKLFSLSKDRLRQNFKFLVEEWKLPPNVILIRPVVLSLSMEKRLKPRLQSLRALMMKSKSSKEAESYPPVRYMVMTEEDFHCKVMSRLPVAT